MQKYKENIHRIYRNLKGRGPLRETRKEVYVHQIGMCFSGTIVTNL